MTLFKNRFRIESTRLKDYDYSIPGEYFVTICTQNHECSFGTIEDGEIKLSTVGKIAFECWKEIPSHFNKVEIDEFVIMPNHIHGIIVIIDDDNPVETRHAVSLHERFGKPTKGSISTIIRSFKSAVTKWIHESMNISDTPVWQKGYYEHIIRDEKDLQNIRDYIINNSLKWIEDVENPDKMK